MKKGMATMAQELQSIKHAQVDGGHKKGEEAKSQSQALCSHEVQSLKIKPMPPPKFNGADNTPNNPDIDNVLAERIADKVC